jgi:hypothetical protein
MGRLSKAGALRAQERGMSGAAEQTPKKAKIVNIWTKRVRGGAGRGIYVVECPCGYESNFDSLSWGGHRALRCKNPRCGLFIAKDTLRVGQTRKEALART